MEPGQKQSHVTAKCPKWGVWPRTENAIMIGGWIEEHLFDVEFRCLLDHRSRTLD
jgi:hypothetical protein